LEATGRLKIFDKNSLKIRNKGKLQSDENALLICFQVRLSSIQTPCTFYYRNMELRQTINFLMQIGKSIASAELLRFPFDSLE